MENVRCPSCGSSSHSVCVCEENPNWIKYVCENKTKCGQFFVWDTKEHRPV